MSGIPEVRLVPKKEFEMALRLSREIAEIQKQICGDCPKMNYAACKNCLTAISLRNSVILHELLVALS